MPGVLKYKDPTTGAWTPTGSPMPEGLKMDLLWENASPTSSFATQTITLNTEDYKYFLLEYMFSSSSPIVRTPFTIINRVGTSAGCYMNNASAELGRDIIVNNGSITIGDCKQSSTVKNTNIVPTRIYGIK